MFKPKMMLGVLAVVLAGGCSSNGALDFTVGETGDANTTGSSAPAMDDGLTAQQLAAEQAAAEAALLSTEDLPIGWSESEPVETPETPEVRSRMASCVGVNGDRVFAFARTVATSPNLNNESGVTIDHTIAVSTEEQAKLYMTNLAAPGVADCLATQFSEFFQNALDAVNDNAADARPTVESVDAEPVDAAPAGDETIAYRFTIVVDFDGARAAVYLDVRATRVGNSISSIFARSESFSPVDGAELDRLTAVAAARLPIEPG